MAESDEFFYMSLGFPKGPFTAAQMFELVRQGTIKAHTSCIKNDEPSVPAEKFFGPNWAKLEADRRHREEAAMQQAEADRQAQRQAQEAQREQQRQQAAQAQAEKEALHAHKMAVRESKRQYQNNYCQTFLDSVNAWILFFHILFYICIAVSSVPFILIIVMSFVQGSFGESLMTIIFYSVSYLIAYVVFRFSMLTIEFMRAVVFGLVTK